MFKDPDLVLAKALVEMAYLCDSMKRLEKAIEAQDASDRRFYLREAADRRERVQRKLLELVPKHAKGVPPFDRPMADPKCEHVWTDDHNGPPGGFLVCSKCGISNKGIT
jgi:hypothetical protein